MKKLGKIKLDQLNKAELSEKELNRLLGGEKLLFVCLRWTVWTG
ncbi:TIGR04149 family rSAM-modified RiPP [Bacteroides uniformis]|nr:TIGR04149 family rSAM-modified RiPP [Bacteroides uniformis]